MMDFNLLTPPHRCDIINIEKFDIDQETPSLQQSGLDQFSFSKYTCNFIRKKQASVTLTNTKSLDHFLPQLWTEHAKQIFFLLSNRQQFHKRGNDKTKSSSRWKIDGKLLSSSFFLLFILIFSCFVTSALARGADTQSSTISSSGRRNLMKPIFSQPVKMRQHNFVKPEGGTVNFRCKAKGKPRPRIQWYKDGNATGPDGSRSNSKALWVLTLRNVQEKDSGRYTCRVWNPAGTISFAYSLQVVSTKHERPVLLEPHPINTTVVEGEKTSLQCWVRSAVPPTVKWIKRLDPDSIKPYDGELPPNALQIDSKFYLVLPAQEMMSFSDGTYLNKLVIKRTRLSDTGMYICLGANTMGYNFRYAYLVVTPARAAVYHEQVAEDQSFPLAVIMAVPTVTGFLFVSFVIFCCIRNQERLNQWSRDKELRQRKRSNVLCQVRSRLTSSSSTANVGVGMETQETVDVLMMQRTPESTVAQLKDSSPSLDSPALSQNLIESDVASNYVVPPSPPPPSQLSHVSSMTSSSRHSRSRHGYKHQNHQHHHRVYHHRSRSHRNHEDEFYSLHCSHHYNLSDQVTL